MVFFYFILAKVEEAECERKFGQSYIDFKNRTGMFLPLRFPFLPQLPKQKGKKIAALICLYLITIAGILSIAKGLNVLTINSLYATYTEGSVNVALSKMSDERINEILSIALSDQAVVEKLNDDGNSIFINYILPIEWFAAEIPMNNIQRGRGHRSPSNYDRNLYKVIFTKAYMRSGVRAEGRNILLSVYLREPIVEVWIDLSLQTVIKILDMPEEIMYKGIPVAVY